MKLDHDVHADLLDLCEYDKILPAHWIEQLVEVAIAKEFTRAESLRRRRAARISSGKSGQGEVNAPTHLPTHRADKA